MRALTTCLLFVALAAGQAANPTEPDDLFVLEIDGKEYEIVGSRETAIPIRGKRTRVRITPRDYRILKTPDFEFQFPRRYSFSFDDTDDQPTWSVDGPLSTITFVQLESTSKKEAMAIFTKAMRFEGAKTFAARLKLPKLKLVGIRIDNDPDGEIVSRTLLFPLKVGTRVWILIITDALDPGQTMTPDLKVAYDMLRKTFRLR